VCKSASTASKLKCDELLANKFIIEIESWKEDMLKKAASKMK
jgi:hypothetical protein